MILIILEVRLMSSEFGNKIKLSIFGESMVRQSAV